MVKRHDCSTTNSADSVVERTYSYQIGGCLIFRGNYGKIPQFNWHVQTRGKEHLSWHLRNSTSAVLELENKKFLIAYIWIQGLSCDSKEGIWGVFFHMYKRGPHRKRRECISYETILFSFLNLNNPLLCKLPLHSHCMYCLAEKLISLCRISKP